MSYAVSNMLGQIVNEHSSHLAPGYYLYTDESIRAMIEAGEIPSCGNLDADGNYVGLRPGFMILGTDEEGNQIRVETCAGNLVEEHLPDVVFLDDPWKPYVKYSQIAVCTILLLLIINRLK